MTNEQKMHNGERRVSSKNGVGNTGQLYAREWNWATILYHTLKLTKWIKHLNARLETISLPEENVGNNLHDTGPGNDILNMTPKAKVTKEK